MINFELRQKNRVETWQTSRIWIYFKGSHEDFYKWLDPMLEKINTLCVKYDWNYDIGYSDQVIYLTKTRN